jgi:hypothetical protein
VATGLPYLNHPAKSAHSIPLKVPGRIAQWHMPYFLFIDFIEMNL